MNSPSASLEEEPKSLRIGLRSSSDSVELWTLLSLINILKKDREMLKKENNIKYSLITEFRDMINSNNNYVLFKYFNNKGRNQWHIICSCMDWISVSVNFMYSLPELSKDIDQKSMQIYSLITSVDNVIEAIKQLHRIFHEDEKLESWPFKEKKHAFKIKLIDCCDEKYFKEIRSCFGAHPTNLKGQRGKESKFFASWPISPIFSDGDLFVNLYPLSPGDEDIKITIKISEIVYFFNERYQYLSCLIKKIDESYKDFCKSKSMIKIPESDSINSELNILKNESKQRLDNEYYNYRIEELIKIFSAKLKEKHLVEKENTFKNKCKSLISEIRNNFQSMNLDDLENSKVISCSLNKSQHIYISCKLFESLESGTINCTYDTYLEYMNDISNCEYKFSMDDDINTTFLKLKVMIYFKNQESDPITARQNNT